MRKSRPHRGPKFHVRGAPLIRISMKQVTDAGVTLLPRLTGVEASVPGLLLVGMPFQFGFTSQLLGGVGRDAGYVASRIAERQGVPRPEVRRSA